ncbi:hypothetical protein [Sphingobacterium paramultivorum]|uniref:hypothetical protein n=1 Tax=Sphingobacterium paramultivorum TaxID=2886510 RepID=UPI00129CCB1C|nr:hypothetical protein [Sphingobacterium paramultivorum]
MRPIYFAGANTIFNKPESMDDRECLPISAYVGENENGMPHINTVWQPSKEDIEAITSGRPIVLSILGTSLPPLSLWTCDEEGQPNF